MASEALNKIRLESLQLNISDIVGENPSWSNRMVNDYFYKQSNIIALAELSDSDADQIVKNTEDIAVNTADIAVNTADIIVSAQNIVIVSGDLSDHELDDSAHGVLGWNVGTLDFAASLTGGTVLLAQSVSDAAVATVKITTSDIGSAPIVYDANYAQEQSDLINECKAKINGLVDDVDSIKTQLNAFLASNKTAKQMA